MEFLALPADVLTARRAARAPIIMGASQ